MKEQTLEPDAAGVVVVACPCGRKIARHIDQISNLAGDMVEVLCIGCKTHRHYFAIVDGSVIHGARKSQPYECGGGWQA